MDKATTSASMSTLEKVMVFSGVVFPGSGLWFIKQRFLAVLFAVPTLIALTIVAKGMWSVIKHIFDKQMVEIAMTGSVQSSVRELIAEAKLVAAENTELVTAKWLLLGLWAGGLLLSWFLASSFEKNKTK